MKKILFPDDWLTTSVSRIEQIKEWRKWAISEINSIDNIISVHENREKIINLWDDMTPEERSNIGGKYSPISFANVSDLKFEALPRFWKGAWLSGMSESMRNSTGTEKQTEAFL